MKRIDLITKWLQDRRRTYADGLSLFLATATPALIAKYGSQLQLADSPPEFSIEFTTLINKLTEIRRNSINFPAQFPGAYEDVIVMEAVQTLSDNEIKSIIEAKQAKRDELLAKLDQEMQSIIDTKRAKRDALLEIEASKSSTPPFSVLNPDDSVPPTDSVTAQLNEHTEQLDEHTAQLNDLSSQQEDSASKIEDNAEDLSNLQDQIDEIAEKTIVDIKEQIDSLSMEIDELKKPGVKFIKESSLPADMAKKYNRIKEIVPLMASLHSELSDMSITGGERMEIAEKLCALDDEKRALWDAIDKWSESTGVNASALRDSAVVATAGAPAEVTAAAPGEVTAAPGTTATDGSLEAGAAIARRILQLKQNITRSQTALNVANQEGNAKNIKSAQARLDKYQAELTELQNQIKGE